MHLVRRRKEVNRMTFPQQKLKFHLVKEAYHDDASVVTLCGQYFTCFDSTTVDIEITPVQDITNVCGSCKRIHQLHYRLKTPWNERCHHG